MLKKTVTYSTAIAVLISIAVTASDLSPIEELNRFEFITDEYIEKINNVQNSWTAGHNFPRGTKISDLKVLMGTKRQRPPVVRQINIDSNIKIPKSFDARKHWPHCKSIRKIQNQGHCGSCWAMSSAATMSDRLCISTKGKFNTDISAQHVISCSTTDGCHGGWPYSAWKYFVDSGSPTGGGYKSKEGCQPYLVKPCINRTVSYGGDYNLLDSSKHPEKCPATDYVATPHCQSKCYNRFYTKGYKKDLHFGKDVFGVPENVTQIQLNIMKYGPVVADFTVYSDFLSYKSGVYEHKVSRIVGGHAIRIIGWDEENGKDYWIIANQWGKEWGSNGTAKFLRGKNECGIEEDVVSGITGSQ